MTTDSKDIRDAPGYRVTREGQVFSCASNWRGYGERSLLITPNSYGYASVRVYRGGRRVRVPVHKLVADAFLPPRPTPAHQVRHKNGLRMDPRADNLEWGTAKENAADRCRHGNTAVGDRNGMRRRPEAVLRGSAHPQALLDEEAVASIRRRYVSGHHFSNAKELAAEFGVKPGTIKKIAREEGWSHVASRTG